MPLEDWPAKPYEGEKPYIFAGYSLKDQSRVSPSIAYLYQSGFRIRYHAGDTSQEADASFSFEKSAVYLAFLSRGFMQEHGLRQQLNQALLQKKPLAAVLLEPLPLPPVLNMQLAAGQVFYLYEGEIVREYYRKLVRADVFLACRNPCKTEKTTEEKRYQEEVVSGTYVLWHKNTGKKLPLSGDTYRIGRSRAKCDYVIDDNLAVSRVHAVLTVRRGTCYLTDPCSTNHIYLNGFQLSAGEEYTLKMSDHINIGGEIFVLEKCPQEGDNA